MYTVAVLPNLTPASEYGKPFDSCGLGRPVVLFAGTRGNIARDPRAPGILCIFTVAKSGARYFVDLDYVKFEARDTTGKFAPMPEL